MSLLSFLGQTYSLKDFGRLLFSTLGSTSLVILAIAFIGFIAYITSITKTKSIVSMDPKLTGISLFSYLSCIFFIPVFIWLFVYQRGQFWLLIGYLLIPIISSLLRIRLRGDGWGYLDFVRIGMPGEIIKLPFSILKGYVDPLLKEILSSTIQIVALVVDFYLFAYFNPTFSLVIWLYFAYFFTVFIIEATSQFGEMSSVLTSDYNKFILKDREIEGFVISRDQDHYFLMTENGTLSIFTSNILEMSHLTQIELNEWRKKADQKILEFEQKEHSKKSKKRDEVKRNSS